MAGLRKLKDKYYVRVRKWNGIKQYEKLVPLRTTNRTEALERQLIVNRYEKDLKNGINIDFPWMNESGNMVVVRYTLKKAINEYLKVRKTEKLRDGTLDIYNRALKVLSNVCGKNMPIDNVSTRHVELYKRQFNSLSSDYANMNLRAVKTFLNWLDYNDMINNIPKIKMVKISKKLPSYFTEQEWIKIIKLKLENDKNKLGLLKYPDIEHYKKAWQLYYNTGCRLSEPFDGHLEGNWLIVDVDNSKTHVQREIYISNYFIDTVKEMQSRLDNHLANNKSKKDFIKRYSRVFKHCCLLIGIKDKHLHHIRHTFAVRRYLEIRDIYQVAKELGHSSVTTTEIYAKFNLSRLERDFPSIFHRRKKVIKSDEIGFRDTDIRDTRYINAGIDRR